MVKHVDEIPITYLNKGQIYTMNVIDTHRPHANGLTQYRTFVRVSFEDDQQRAKPAGCWQLWKEGRGTTEAHQRGGRLQAVEYVESTQLVGPEDSVRPKVELQSASFDGFCVTWSSLSGPAECSVPVRFNFLSTDFSHSKGVKGIPVRLCAKTEIVSESSPQEVATTAAAEVCYCKVKLFRDHGAERKLSNDVAHVKKTIDKLNQQIAQVESGVRDLGKRKRSLFARSSDERPSKLSKHRRTWSLSSLGSSAGRNSADDELHMKLLALQDMFSSTRPASVLHLRGAPEDDPDLFPVKLTAETESIVRHDSANTGWDQQSNSSSHSPTPSNRSGSHSRRDSTIHQFKSDQRAPRFAEGDWQSQAQTATADLIGVSSATSGDGPSVPVAIKVKSGSPSASSGKWVDVLDVDSTYEPPTDRVVKPIACVYVKTREEVLYRAIYLMQRTVKDLVNGIAMKRNIEPTSVAQVVHITRQKLPVLFDDDCVKELSEGQDMLVEFVKLHNENEAAPEWGPEDIDVQVDGDLSTLENVTSNAYELRLLF